MTEPTFLYNIALRVRNIYEMKFKKTFSFATVAILLCAFVSVDVFSQNVAPSSENPVCRDFKTELMWNAKVKIGSMINVGESKRGTRRMIPITGGTFSGPQIKGDVLSGGEDWQLVRPDGDTELCARYLLKTEDGVIIQITNNALMHAPAQGEGGGFYVRSFLDVEAPTESRYDYLNHALFIGTLEVPPLKPGEEPYVIIGVYKLL